MDGDFSENVIHLQVTAEYSKPTVTSSCPDDFSCTVTCASHGGYPSTRIMWDVPKNRNTSRQMWKVVNNSEERIPGTVMFTSSSTAYFNCSKGEMKFLSCFVGDIHSDRFSVCKYRTQKRLRHNRL
ncbi:hypothetical protein Q5P01_010117 [Channa striata]|uniref:CD80-like immunoglobulin C2-set domain-containing protein n=1 Tax=Channa striata TaxID=64152 RepID=A0AA88SQ83_CHASR|nr:hypothetical protein Q5P01_010117 [Channa striata]